MRNLTLWSLGALCAASFSMAAMRGVQVTAAPEKPHKGFATTFSVGPALSIPGSGPAQPGFSSTFATPVAYDVPLYVGADVAFYFTTSGPFSGTVPVLGTMYYEFVSTNPRVRPLLGVSAGPAFFIGAGQPLAQFAMLLKPGLNIQLADGVDLSVESRLGVIGSNFTYFPQISASFAM